MHPSTKRRRKQALREQRIEDMFQRELGNEVLGRKGRKQKPGRPVSFNLRPQLPPGVRKAIHGRSWISAKTLSRAMWYEPYKSKPIKRRDKRRPSKPR